MERGRVFLFRLIKARPGLQSSRNRGTLIITTTTIRGSQGWKGIFSHDGGWLAAGKAINAIGEVLRERGVNFGFGG